jgi:hypothetical protein
VRSLLQVQQRLKTKEIEGIKGIEEFFDPFDFFDAFGFKSLISPAATPAWTPRVETRGWYGKPAASGLGRRAEGAGFWRTAVYRLRIDTTTHFCVSHSAR